MKKKEKNRAQILEKAALLFNKKGFYGTSMDLLVKETGLTKGSIYNNFEDKNALALEAFDYNLNWLIQKLGFKQLAGENSIQQLVGFLQFSRASFKDIIERGGCAILNTSTDADDNHPELKKKVTEALENWKNSLKVIIAKGQIQGEIKPDINAEKFALKMVAVFEGGILLAKTTGKLHYFNMLMEDLEREILENLKL
ncbi:TetR/AcrR family transcriptional regulator [Flexithrix dorotheae]|uniref:TetR/AcrR family transcriptional regulator n=1 Tax=Flexithrix dorotheae TaxID=70993 RepID=UPI0003A98689|nr:TetR/AcrR family transcriptional regulator [Flexithrix dorotheae]